MLNVFDPLFILEDNDLLSVGVNGSLSPENIDETINTMVQSIANSMGYNTCTSFDKTSFTQLDALYENSKSIVIPIFNEKVDSNSSLGNTLTNANVSFLVITPKCGVISKTSENHYYCTDSTGTKIEDLSSVGKVMCSRLTNIRFYRYANITNTKKYDCNPCCLDIISPIYYGYKLDTNNNEVKYVKVCIENIANFYMSQQVMEFIPYTLPISPTDYASFVTNTNKIKQIGDDNINFDNDIIDINSFNSKNPFCCHIYNKFYCISNE